MPVSRWQQGKVRVVVIDRPDRANAIDLETAEALAATFDELERDDDTWAVVLTGAGERVFSAGMDLGAVQDGHADAINGVPGGFAGVVRRDFPKPIVAAVNGGCAGIGLVLALMCDIRFAADGAKLTTAFSRRGLVAEYGIAWILPRLVGPARALDLLFSGRVVLGDEAAALGLVNRALPAERLLDETLAYARELAVNASPASMAAMKAQVYADLERPLAKALADADRRMLASFAAPDFREGVASFIERREPRFAPLVP